MTTANAGVAQFIEFNSPTVAGSGGTWTLTAGSTYSLGFVNVNTDNDDNSSNLNVSLLSYAAMAGPGPGPGGVPEIDAGTATFPLAVVGLIFLVIGDGRRRKAMAKL